MKCRDFPFFDPECDQALLSELLEIVAPDRETFLALCAGDLAAGYEVEVYEAARRLFPEAADAASGVSR